MPASNIVVTGPISQASEAVLTREALDWLAQLHREFNPTRIGLLRRRAERQAEIDAGVLPDFLGATRSVRETPWRIAPLPADLRDRRVEITGPAERKMIVNALSCGARVFMADFEDALSPTWSNILEGQVNLSDAIDRTIEVRNPDGRVYRLADRVATLLVRPRGWHLEEKHVLVDGAPISASLFDFGLYFLRNARRLLEQGSGPYFYLPKLESHLEARLWNEVFNFAQDALGIDRGSIKATVLIETILGAFEMEEILYELREHSGGLNAGRWDYLFSIIKKFRNHPQFMLADRNQLSMAVPFMRAYAELLVRTCHRHGAPAIGGMAAFIPSRRNPEINQVAFAKVREDKEREAAAGFDGTWIAHPDLVAVATEIFDRVLGSRANQIDRSREDVTVSAHDLLDVQVPGLTITEAGLRNDVSVGIQYLEAWLSGVGAAAIFDLMEDAATAEIARSQIWQWLHNGAVLADGPRVTADLIRQVEHEELAKISEQLGAQAFARGRFKPAQTLFEQVALAANYPEFLTLPAYQILE